MKLKLYNIEDNYIKYLSTIDSNVCDNKMGKRKHYRKYIGTVLNINGIKYFSPLSSPKKKDYEPDGSIRKDPIFLVRIKTINEYGQYELKGRILIGNMIPILDSVVTVYDIKAEKDENYKTLIIKEMDFITKNRNNIINKANVIYNQKIGVYFTKSEYIKHTVDFKLLEKNI